MTMDVMRAFGALRRANAEWTRFEIDRGAYQSRDYEIEPDASAASYFWAAAAITQGRVTVEGLSRSSSQGDVSFASASRRWDAR